MRTPKIVPAEPKAPLPLTEAREFALQNMIEDNTLYGGENSLLNDWTTSLLGETWLEIIKSSEREASWEERAPLHRKRNILLGIQGALKNETNRVSSLGSSVFTTRNR